MREYYKSVYFDEICSAYAMAVCPIDGNGHETFVIIYVVPRKMYHIVPKVTTEFHTEYEEVIDLAERKKVEELFSIIDTTFVEDIFVRLRRSYSLR
jgi:hypothetical protein